MDDLIRSFDVPIIRNLTREREWSYSNYFNQILEAIEFHCEGSPVSDYMKHQISRIMHQGYVLINEIPFSSPVRSIYESMEKIVSEDNCRGVLKNITKQVGFPVLHTHFAQSSCIIENWKNFAHQTNLSQQAFSVETMYESLISSLDKPKKTGEWIVFSKTDNGIVFWCIWLHSAGDEKLIEIIKNQCV
ncbi:hypothetical protein [Sulfurimonas sp. HSL-1716]|uniref:hypothetical protein n=1 Tax=Hydrocurvibacter sulfurireducens TaxID=3131937 RepID=UPI0031F8F9BF